MKAKTKSKLLFALTSLTMASLFTGFGFSISCANTASEQTPPQNIDIIDQINKSIDSIKPNNPNISQADFNSINESNVINTISLPTYIDKSQLSIKEFNKTSNTISFKLYADGKYSNTITLYYSITNDSAIEPKVKISLNQNQYLEGSTITANATITPSSLTGITYRWEVIDSTTNIPSTSSTVTFKANALDNNKILKVTANYKGKDVSSDTATLKIKAKEIEISNVSLSILELNDDPNKKFFEGDTMTFKATISPSNINKTNITYQWIMISKSGETILGTTNNTKDYFTYTCKNSDNDNSIKVKVIQNVNDKQIVKESAPEVIQVQIPDGGITPDIDSAELKKQEIEKWKTHPIPQQTLTTQDVNELRNPDSWTSILEQICNDNGLLDNDNFVYDFANVIVTNNTVTFTVNVYGDESDDPNSEFDIHDVSFQYILQSSTPDESKMNEAIAELNAIDWNNINYDSIVSKGLTFRNLTYSGTKSGYILNYIKNFSEREFNTKYKSSLSINESTWNIDVLQQTISFKITVAINDLSSDTNIINIKYNTPQQQLGDLDKLPTDNDIKISTSYKGILTIVNPNSNVTSEQLYNGYFDNYFHSANNNYNNQNKWFEMLYQLRFVLYQSFGDNASSIDYGVQGNQAILKAKIKNDMTINQPYIQLMNDQSVKNSISLKTGEILTLSLTPSELNYNWETTNSGNALTGLKEQYLLGKGPEKEMIINGPKTQSLGFNAGHWSFNVSSNSRIIASLSNFIFRNNFTFSLPYYVK